jgi:hypothetical protein
MIPGNQKRSMSKRVIKKSIVKSPCQTNTPIQGIRIAKMMHRK